MATSCISGEGYHIDQTSMNCLKLHWLQLWLFLPKEGGGRRQDNIRRTTRPPRVTSWAGRASEGLSPALQLQRANSKGSWNRGSGGMQLKTFEGEGLVFHLMSYFMAELLVIYGFTFHKYSKFRPKTHLAEYVYVPYSHQCLVRPAT